MKYLFLMTAALTSLCLLTSHNTVAAQNNSAIAEKQARWFEIEVILFKQISKMSDKEEQFPLSDLSDNKRRTFDLLAPYLQPDISSLKQLLPNCEQPNTKLPYNIMLSTLWPEKQETESNEVNSTDKDTVPLQAQNQSSQNNTPSEALTLIKNKDSKDKEEVITPTNMSTSALVTASNEQPDENENSSTEQDLSKTSDQSGYANIELPSYTQYPSNSQSPLCVIPAEYFQQHLSTEQLEQFSLDGFPVEKLTNTVNGLEQWQDDENGKITWASDKPYLISQDSLRLKSIANSIKRSRNYAPLLHLGWRQIGETKRNAKAVNLYAGEHLDLDYQQAISARHAEQKTLEVKAILEQRLQEKTLPSQANLVANTATDEKMSDTQNASNDLAIKNPDNFTELSISEQLALQAKKQQLENLFHQLSLLDNQTQTPDKSSDNTHELRYKEEEVKRIVTQLSADITSKEVNLIVNNTTDKKMIITEPLQPWSVDGLFKVYLENRYLFIDTEFNIVKEAKTQSVLSEKTTISTKRNKNSNQTNVISFKQDRRVISGEIHYFDHPHIGMIVQIRRFDPSKPADEAVTQAKK